MLGELSRRIEQNLRARKCPVRVEYGPVAPTRVAELRDVVVVEYDRAGGDQIGGPKARGGNPRRRFNRAVGCVATVYARSNVQGARRQDHEDRAQAIVDALLCSLDDEIRGGKSDAAGVQIPGTQHSWSVGRGSFVDDAPGDSTGAVYALPFAIDRGVHDVAFGGGAAPEFVLAEDSIASRTKVFGSTGEGAGETSCGG